MSRDEAYTNRANILFAEVQTKVTPITSKIYSGGDYAPGADDEQDPLHGHDEL